MRVAILANDKASFIKPMAEGLANMLRRLDAEPEVFYDGLAILDFSVSESLKRSTKNGIKILLNGLGQRHHVLEQIISRERLSSFEEQLKTFDVLVVVCNIPDAFLASRLIGIERFRRKFSLPVVLYQNYYLATRGPWINKIKKCGGFGLERYDWYLAASMVSEYPLTTARHPCSLIGHDLRCNSLNSEKKKHFRVLLDFERKGNEKERALQIQALETLKIDYLQLEGHYSQQEIRQLYSQYSAICLSSRESFGLPIVENQLCGNLIFTPHRNWAPSHYINKSVLEPGEASLGRNFYVYNNDMNTLKEQLSYVQQHYEPKHVIENFRQEYPHLYHGDLTALNDCITKVRKGDITCHSHLEYEKLNSEVVADSDC